MRTRRRGRYYDAAKAGEQVPPDVALDLANLCELPAMQDALKAAAPEYQNVTGKVANLDAPDFGLWNLAKPKLDDALSTTEVAGEQY